METCEHFSTEHDKLQDKDNQGFFEQEAVRSAWWAVDPLKEVCADGARELLCQMKSTSSVSSK